jgi:hypothetical protein
MSLSKGLLLLFLVLILNSNNAGLSKPQTKSAKVVKQQSTFLVLETNQPDSSLLVPFARHLFYALLEQQNED